MIRIIYEKTEHAREVRQEWILIKYFFWRGKKNLDKEALIMITFVKDMFLHTTQGAQSAAGVASHKVLFWSMKKEPEQVGSNFGNF